ncbi:hypothetical protein ABZX95_17225 [Streptomyces sp. NPDC004232]|uniref:hypothetical protein n=1 Tax=Streptomyces sp. NPDC004232 TaxID=3154454 RepID=UPI0033BD321A
MSRWPTFQEGERVTAYLHGEDFECTVLREDFEAGDAPDNPSGLRLRRHDTGEEIRRSKDSVLRANGDPVHPTP